MMLEFSVPSRLFALSPVETRPIPPREEAPRDILQEEIEERDEEECSDLVWSLAYWAWR